MLAATLIVIVIAQDPDVDSCEPGMCGGTSMVSAFQQAVQRVLGGEAQIQTQLVATDPPDEEDETKAQDVDGVVELSFSPEGRKARLHCYVSREKRWLDREISFGESRGSVRSEITERGRLLGFAVATMYAGDASDTEQPPAAPPPPVAKAAAPNPVLKAAAPAPDRPEPPRSLLRASRVAEFGAIASSGLDGPASGLGASAGFRLSLAGPLWARLFVAGRSGNIPEAQASTRTVLLGGGLTVALLPEASPFELGVRLDALGSYFDVSHLSEDDIETDRRSRWQLGADLVAEGGWRFTHNAGVFLGAGMEAMLGKTEIYTHRSRVAVVPPFRVTAELGFRTRF